MVVMVPVSSIDFYDIYGSFNPKTAALLSVLILTAITSGNE